MIKMKVFDIICKLFYLFERFDYLNLFTKMAN